MEVKQCLEQTQNSLVDKILNGLKNIKPVYVLYAMVPLIFIYPKPLVILLKPIIRNWSYHYRKISSVTNKPSQIILAANPNICFTKQFLKNLQIVKGTLPLAFQIIQSSIRSQQKIRDSQDESMKHVLIQRKHQFQKQKIFNSCFVIDMHNANYIESKTMSSSEILNIRKNSHSQFINSGQQNENQSIYSQTDFIWLQMILMKLKILQLQNNSEVIKYVIIKANQRVLQLLQAKILGIGMKDAFKLGSFSENKIHLLKLNKNLDSYQQCCATFKIQQTLQ